MKRGAFIKNCLYTIGSGSLLFKLPFHSFVSISSKKDMKEMYERLFSKLENGFVLEKYAAEIGEEYISKQESKLPNNFYRDDFNSAYYLQKLIEKDGNLANIRLQKLIRQDFGNNNTVRLKGWVLSETEAKLSALYKMTT